MTLPQYLTRTSVCVAAMLVTAPLSVMAEDAADVSFEASAGMAADSNVGIPDLDQTTDEGDIALLLSAKVQLDLKPVDRLVLRGGYEFSQTAYQDFSDFDLQTHRGFAEAEYDFGPLKAGILANQAHARVDDAGYLNYTQISPNVSRLFSDRLYLRAAYVRTEKDFKTDDARDASVDGARVDAFYFTNGTRQYVSLGGEIGTEDAKDEAFDLSSTSAKASFVQRFDVMEREARLKIGAAYEMRDYENITPAIAKARADKVTSAQGEFEIPLAGPVSVAAEYAYTDRQSNLPTADYDEHVGSVELKVAF